MFYYLFLSFFILVAFSEKNPCLGSDQIPCAYTIYGGTSLKYPQDDSFGYDGFRPNSPLYINQTAVKSDNIPSEMIFFMRTKTFLLQYNNLISNFSAIPINITDDTVSSPMFFNKPQAISKFSDDSFLVADSGCNCISLIKNISNNYTGNSSDRWLVCKEGNCFYYSLNQPSDVIFDTYTEKIFIADTSNANITILNSDFSFDTTVTKDRNTTSLYFLPKKIRFFDDKTAYIILSDYSLFLLDLMNLTLTDSNKTFTPIFDCLYKESFCCYVNTINEKRTFFFINGTENKTMNFSIGSKDGINPSFANIKSISLIDKNSLIVVEDYAIRILYFNAQIIPSDFGNVTLTWYSPAFPLPDEIKPELARHISAAINASGCAEASVSKDNLTFDESGFLRASFSVNKTKYKNVENCLSKYDFCLFAEYIKSTYHKSVTFNNVSLNRCFEKSHSLCDSLGCKLSVSLVMAIIFLILLFVLICLAITTAGRSFLKGCLLLYPVLP